MSLWVRSNQFTVSARCPLPARQQPDRRATPSDASGHERGSWLLSGALELGYLLVATETYLETSPSPISASCCGCRRAADRAAYRARGNLSQSADTFHRRLCCRRTKRHFSAPHGPVAVGAARAAIHCRESAGRRRQCRTELVVHAPADGYTLLLVPAPAAINATLYDNLNFNFIRDIAPVAGILRVPEVMVVNPSVPAKSVP